MASGRGRIHCIGIGGAGMGPLAEVLHARGWTVTGSDRQRSSQSERLARLGIKVQYGHDADLVTGAEMVVYSSAIRADNPERAWAASHGVPQYRRAEILGDLTRGAWSVAVAGTHGKTTTTALVGHVLARAGLRPTVLVGGEVVGLGSNALIGGDRLLVTEADEFDRTFLALHPTVAVITNIEADHLDCYRDLAEIKDAFTAFAGRVPFYGAVVANADDPGVREVLPRIARRTVTCGLAAGAMYRAEHRRAPSGTSVDVWQAGRKLGTFEMALVGEHNVRNALVALAAATESGATFAQFADAAPQFAGVRRRLERVGEAAGVTVIDDYAHHPTEIRASLAAARAMGFGRLVTVFQPHLYTRTRDFMDGFAESLAASDVVVVADIYAAREEPIPGVSARGIVDKLAARGHRAVHHVADGAAAVRAVLPLVRSGDAVLLMGAGDINQAAGALLAGLGHGTTVGR